MARRSSSLPEKGGFESMWKKLAKELNFPESYVSITLGFLIVIIGGILFFNYFNRTSLPESLEQQAERGRQEQAANQARSGTHTVGANETLWSISEKYYGTGYNWPQLAEANRLTNPDRVKEGTVLVIPTVQPSPIPTVQEKDILADSTQQPRTFTVVKGDTLWKIAVSQYSDGYAWTKIAQANALKNPNLIHPGNVLKIP